MIVEELKYYLYRHIRLDTNEVFYIGIGTQNDEMRYQRAKVKNKRNDFWKNITKKTNYKVEIIIESDDYEFIKEKEIEFIALYGRRNLGNGTLCNLTNGGDGTLGRVHSDESKVKISIAASNISEENKQKISEFMKGNTYSVGRKLSEEHKQKISKSLRGNTRSLGKKRTEHTKKKMSEARKGSKCYAAKLTEEEVYEIKYGLKNLKQKEIAQIYGLSKYTVSDIRTNRTWKHI